MTDKPIPIPGRPAGIADATYAYNISLADDNGIYKSPNNGWSGMSTASIVVNPLMNYEYREIAFEELKMDEVAIGSGAFGVVHKGTWRGATVAVKKLLVVMDEEQLAHEVRREATVIQGVANHPNIVRFYGACTKKQPYCLVTSLYPRGSVFTLLRKINFEWRTLVGFARDAAAGILHLHCENVIHRDIATRNLLVDDQWTVRISDFGLARIKVKATSQTKSSVGPVKWMAPEALKEKQYSVKSDVYSFGILMWELVARKEPYEDMEAIQVALGVLHDGLRPMIPDTTPREFSMLMRRCWDQDPEKRPDFKEILETLQEYYNSLPQIHDPATIPTLTNSLSASSISLSTGSVGIHSKQPIQSTNQDLECQICGEIFDRVMETPCCHACYCSTCVSEWITKAGSCPKCRAPIQINQLRPNVPVQRFVDNMPADCMFAVDGCTDRITRGIVKEHEAKCGYAYVECDGYKQFMDSFENPQLPANPNSNSNSSNSTSSNTSAANGNSTPPSLTLTRNLQNPNRNSLGSDHSSSSISPPSSPHTTPSSSRPDWSANSVRAAKPCGKVQKKDMQHHKTFNCPFRMVDCIQDCGQKIRYIQLEDHLQVCPNVEIDCPNGCGLRTNRGLMVEHREKVCELQIIPCKYSAWGCQVEMTRKKISSHYESDSAPHLALAEVFINERQAKIVQMKESREDLFRRFAKAKEENVHLRLTIEGLSALKPHLPFHPLNVEPVILPCSLVIPELGEAMSLLSLEADGRTISYQPAKGFFPSKLPGKAVLVRSDRLIPNANVLFYFEICLKNTGKDGAIGIGIANGPDVYAMPGWNPNTYGYHGDDGRKFGHPHHQFGQPFGPVWQKDDIVGCGWDQIGKRVFFTLNGKFLGNAFENVDGNFAAAIGLHTQGAKVKVNFGQDPFAYDLQKHIG